MLYIKLPLGDHLHIKIVVNLKKKKNRNYSLDIVGKHYYFFLVLIVCINKIN